MASLLVARTAAKAAEESSAVMQASMSLSSSLTSLAALAATTTTPPPPPSLIAPATSTLALRGSHSTSSLLDVLHPNNHRIPMGAAGALSTATSSPSVANLLLSSSSTSALPSLTTAHQPQGIATTTSVSNMLDVAADLSLPTAPALLWQDHEDEDHSSSFFLDDLNHKATVPLDKSLRHALLGVATEEDLDALNMESHFSSWFRPKIVGHRGALFEELENTRASFLRCVELGCDAVELDVYLLKDGQLVVFHGGGGDVHPGDLSDHCLGMDGKSILDLTYAEASTLRFNPSHKEFACPPHKLLQGQIPLLEDVLRDLKGSGLQVKIELKGPGTVQPVLELVERLDAVDQCCYSSFHHAWLKELRDLRPNTADYPTGALFTPDSVPTLDTDLIQMARDCGATEVHLPYSQCTKQRVEALHHAGLGSMVWLRGPVGMQQDMTNYWDVGNEDDQMYATLFETGVQQVCLNKPHVAMPLLERMKSNGSPAVMAVEQQQEEAPHDVLPGLWGTEAGSQVLEEALADASARMTEQQAQPATMAA